MREFYIQRGKNQGVHYIFDDTTEAIKYLTGELKHLNVNNQDLSDPLKAFKFWHEFGEYKDGDWIKSDDGRVVQCLKYTELISKDKKTKEPVRYKNGILQSIYICKIALGTWGRKRKANGELSYRRMDLDYYWTCHSYSRSSITDNRLPQGKYMNDKKRSFALYCVIFGNPLKAYKHVYPEKCKTYYQQIRMVQNAYFLLVRPEILKEVQKYMSLADFRDRLRQALQEAQVDEERLAREYAEGLDSAKKGSQNHRQFIELGIQMLKYLESLDDRLETTKPTVLQLPTPELETDNNAIYLPEENIKQEIKDGS